MSKSTPLSTFWRALTSTYKSARRIVIAVVGASVVLVGVAMLVLPGPAFVVIPTGLAILGLEFAWARRWLRAVKRRTKQGIDRLRAANGSAPSPRSTTLPASAVGTIEAPAPQVSRNPRT